jgi:FAD:protein FMN transferase
MIRLKRRQVLQWGMGLGLSTVVPLSQGLHWRERVLQGFGTTLHLRAAHAHSETLEHALNEAVHVLGHIEAQMSLFDANSALSQLNRDGVLHWPDPHLLAVLRLASEVSAKSQGAFDITVQGLWTVWDQSKNARQKPSQAQLSQAKAHIDWRAVDIHHNRVSLTKPGVQITLNGIAQGYAADQARLTLQRFGIEHALLDTGEWTSLGKGPKGKPWRIGLANPHQEAQLLHRLSLSGDSVATSSDAQTVFTQDRVHHHIFDPKTGFSPPDVSLVCVVAPSCALADALTKVFFVAGAANAEKVVKLWQVKALVVDKLGQVYDWL